MQDIYGSTITANPDGTWTRGGVTVGPCDAATALHTLNGMTPDGWETPPPPAAVPQTVALWQAKAALAGVGKLAMATDIVTGIGGTIALAWEYGNTIDRSSPALQAMADRLGLSSDDLDNLFIAASKISI